MKTLTITYHWMPNYGAVLQAYALQRFLLEHNIDNKIINYVPRRIKWRSYFGYVKRRELQVIKRISCTRAFVRKELICTDKKYVNHKQLKNMKERSDAVICGSDQIWCEWFIKNAESKYTYSYYLDFVNYGKRIAYAVSLGNPVFHINEIKTEISRYLKAFEAIGVRENTGKDFVESYGVSAKVVCDPVFLIKANSYMNLVSKSNTITDAHYIYILHNKTSLPIEIANTKLKDHSTLLEVKTVYDWLSRIKHSKYILTDSFHCVAFSIIFHVPFIVVPAFANGFDDRITTILNRLLLKDRMCITVNEALNVPSSIDWNMVDDLLKQYVDESKQFLLDCLER